MKKFWMPAALAALTISAVAPAMAQQVQKWKDCGVQCRIVFVRGICPEHAPENISKADEAELMKISSLDELERKVRASCEARKQEQKQATQPGQSQKLAGYHRYDDDNDGYDRRRYDDGRRLHLNSLGPNGRVIRGRPAPAEAIPCVVNGVRGKCVPR